MKAVKERIACIWFAGLFLSVIMGINVIGYYDRTLYDCTYDTSFSLDRGVYRVILDTAEADADAYCVYYEVNGQQHILAQGDVTDDAFEMTLPSNIQNDSVRVTVLTEEGTQLPRLDAVRMTRLLPIMQTIIYLVLYLVIAALLYAGFSDRGKAGMLTGAVSMALLPLYPVFCAAPGPMTCLLVMGTAILFVADRKMKMEVKSIVRYIFFLALSLTALYFCTESSPFYARNPWDDASIYFSIGKGIVQGYVPYRDMFDHKGPVVFFLFALGYLLTPDRFYGIYLLESLCFSGVLYFSFKIAGLYFEEGISEVLAVISMIFFLNGSFLVYGGSCEEFTMVIYAAVLYQYLAYFSGRKECTGRRMAVLGGLCAFTFWMKFTMTVCLLVLMGILLWQELFNRRHFVRKLAAFSGGGLAVSAAVVGYFLYSHAIGYLRWGYFTANLAYADIRSTGETMILFGKNVMSAVTHNPGITLVVVTGLVGFTLTSRYIEGIFGRLGLLLAFGLLLGSTYVSHTYLYYYCLVAVFAILGIVTIAGVLTDRVKGFKIWRGSALILTIPCLLFLLVVNQNYRNAALFSENFTLYDVFQKEMERVAKGETKTLLLYRNHWAQMMTFPGMLPAQRYYFAPNISENMPVINEEQDRYIHEGIADFVLVDAVEIYPFIEEWGLYQYEQILDWRTDRYSVQLYYIKEEQRRAEDFVRYGD